MHQHGDVPARHHSGPIGIPTKAGGAVPAPAAGRARPEHEGRPSAEFDGIGMTWREVRRNGDSLKPTFLGYCAEPFN